MVFMLLWEKALSEQRSCPQGPLEMTAQRTKRLHKSIIYPNKSVYTQLHKTIAFNQHGYIGILAISDKVLCVCAVSGITNPISIYTELLINVYLFPINNFIHVFQGLSELNL